jgi:hypothetical protein
MTKLEELKAAWGAAAYDADYADYPASAARAARAAARAAGAGYDAAYAAYYDELMKIQEETSND